jgi:ribosomal protein S18 acetylase RimI-like enzyme
MIRPAIPSDATAVVPLIIQAMDKLARKLTHVEDENVINQIFKHFFMQRGNQYSYENTLVFEEEGKVLGSLNAYDGEKLPELRKPFLHYVKEHYHASDLNQGTETENGEFYLDSISVNPLAQGKGIGKQLIKAGIDWAEKLDHHTVGLLVEKNNPNALRLYEKMNFFIQNEKQFMGGLYHHMVYKIK